MTFDSPVAGVRIAQPARGFRYTSDAMWLTGFALGVGPRPSRALDLGTGSGVIALLLAARGIPTVGVDVRPEWAPLWRETLAASRTLAPVELVQGDIADGVDGPFDLVVSNPPFFAAGTGPVAPDPWRRAARTESTAPLARFVEVALHALAPGGRFCVVLPREREDALLAASRGVSVERQIRIGRRRTVFCLGSGPVTPIVTVDEDSELVRGWVDAATAEVDHTEPRSY